MKPLIDQAFWSDPDIERSKPGVKLAALWLITNSQTNLLGICGASESRFTFETGLEKEALGKALEALSKSFVRVGPVIFLRNYVRHQFGAGDQLTRNNFFKPLKSLFTAVKDDALRKLILEEYPEFESAHGRASEALPKGLPSPSIGREGKGKGREGGERVQREGRPTIEEIKAYGLEIALAEAESDKFFDYFQSNGWRVGGKADMKDWKAALRNWQRNGSSIGNGKDSRAKNTQPVPDHLKF